MNAKNIPNETLARIAAEFGTPCWIYDAGEIRRRVKTLEGFGTIRYAQKANSNIHILALMRKMGVLVDAVSLGEIERAVAAGYDPRIFPSAIVYTSDVIDQRTIKRVCELEIPVNVGSPRMLEQLGKVSSRHPVWLRINPGFGSGLHHHTCTGGEFSKHGIWHETVAECYQLLIESDLHLVGLHMHIGSGADFEQLQRVCDAMIAEVKKCPLDIQAISIGGGLPIPYREDDREVDIQHYLTLWHTAIGKIEAHVGHKVSLEIEPGRYLVGTSGYLMSGVSTKKKAGMNEFVILDAGFNDLQRPATYGSYHKISVISKTGEKKSENIHQLIVGGPLCEAGDLFTQESGGIIVKRELPDPDFDDLFVFSDCGAYCATLSSNYNSRPLAPEVLVDGFEYKQIRRRQTINELISLELERV